MDARALMKIFDDLPAHAKLEAIDFIRSLRNRCLKSASEKSRKSSKMSSEKFVGMWKDHSDLKDSGAWLRRLRHDEWNN